MGPACHGVAVACLLITLASLAGATQFRVGGSMGWTVPADPNAMTYNQWASKLRFQIGDSLLFVYEPDKDSVLQVTNEDYSACRTTSPIATFDDGHTLFTFKQSGPFYFISGHKDNCLKNESMVVVVLADRSNKPAPVSSPPSNNAGVPVPSGGESANPPPPPPSATNVAAPKVVGAVSSVGALLGSYLFFFM